MCWAGNWPDGGRNQQLAIVAHTPSLSVAYSSYVYTVCMYIYLYVLYTPSILILILSQCPSCSHEWAHLPSSILAHCTSSTYIIYIIHITSHILYQTHCRIVHGILNTHTHSYSLCSHDWAHQSSSIFAHCTSSTYHIYIIHITSHMLYRTHSLIVQRAHMIERYTMCISSSILYCSKFTHDY